MTIEIKELVIKASVDNSTQNLAFASAQNAGSPDSAGQAAGSNALPVINSEQLVEQCVEQVLRILDRQKSR